MSRFDPPPAAPPACLGPDQGRGRTLEPEQIESSVLGTRRTIRIWLPPSYASAMETRYPVLYLKDGQNMLSAAGPHVAYGWGSWEVDRSLERLVAAGRMRELILVAVYHTTRRYQEYRGPLSPGAPGGNPDYQRYAAFLVQELKPYIDRRFRTLPEPQNTGLLGGSMGGLGSLALAWEHPNHFGIAGCLSGAFQVQQQQFLRRVVRSYNGPPKPLRVYLDCGARSADGGDEGRAHTEAVVTELRRIGWRDGANLWFHVDEHPLTPAQLLPLNLPEDKFNEAQVEQHNELYWRRRVWRPLEFLFPVP